MSLAIGAVYEYDGWLFVPVSLFWPVYTVLTLDIVEEGFFRREYGRPGETTEVFANSMVGQNAREVG